MIDPNEPAYNGDTEPQRGPLSPRQRDILCRLIRNYLAELRLRNAWEYRQSLPPFLRDLDLGENTEIALLLDARDKLSPRTDDARAVQGAIEHDAAAGLGKPRDPS